MSIKLKEKELNDSTNSLKSKSVVFVIENKTLYESKDTELGYWEEEVCDYFCGFRGTDYSPWYSTNSEYVLYLNTLKDARKCLLYLHKIGFDGKIIICL